MTMMEYDLDDELLSAYLDGELSAEERARVERLLDERPEWRQLVDELAAIRSQVNDEPAKVYRVGEGFYEMPGSHHRVSENASDSEPASLLAVFVVDTKDAPLTTPDAR